MNLKKLIEKRNTLLTEADNLIENAEKEVRSLSNKETDRFDVLTSDVEAVNLEIKTVEDLRKKGEKIEMEERDMTNMKKEVRGLEQYLRKEDGEEVRALNVTTDGKALIPENVEGSIILKMEETSPVFARARKFPSVSGTLKIAKENENSAAGFVGEGTEVAEHALNLGEVKLTQKRVGAAISLSNQLINDSAINVVEYSVNLLARRTAKAVEKSILTGSALEEFKGIVGDLEVPAVEAEGAITIDTLMDLYNAVHPEFIGDSCYYMSRTFFNQVAKLKDGNNHFYLQNGVVNGKLTYTLLGAEVSVTDSLPATTPAIFGSIEDAYGVMIKQGFALQHIIADTTQALRGSQLLVLDGYMDGAVYNPQAIAKLEVTAGV